MLLLLFFDFLDFLTVFDELLLLLTLEGLEFGLVVLGDDDDAAAVGAVDVLFSKLTFAVLFLDDFWIILLVFFDTGAFFEINEADVRFDLIVV